MWSRFKKETDYSTVHSFIENHSNNTMFMKFTELWANLISAVSRWANQHNNSAGELKLQWWIKKKKLRLSWKGQFSSDVLQLHFGLKLLCKCFPSVTNKIWALGCVWWRDTHTERSSENTSACMCIIRSPPAVYSITKHTCSDVWKHANRFTRNGCLALFTVSKIRFSHIKLTERDETVMKYFMFNIQM